MNLIDTFNPNHLTDAVRRKSPLAIQREIILQYLFNALTGFGIIGLGVYLATTRIDSSTIVLTIPFLLTILIQVAISASRQLPYTLRAVILLLLIALTGFAPLATLGLSGSFLIYSITFIAVITVLFGEKAGAISIVCISLFTAVAGALILTGRLPMPGNINSDLTALISAWLREFLAFVLTATSISGAYVQLTNGLSGALTQQKALAAQMEIDQAQLEIRVQNRTEELSRKSNLLEAAREVSNILVSEMNTEELLNSAASVILDQFMLNRVAIYLKDPNQDVMRLRAWAGEEGQDPYPQKVAFGYNQPGVVSYVAHKGMPYLGTGSIHTLDGQPIASSETNIILEIGVPIKVGEKTMGVLDLHTKREEEFNPSDLDIFSTLANQLSIALENARLFQELEQELRKSESSVQQATQKDWYTHLKASKRRYAYRYSQNDLDTNLLQTEESTRAIQSGITVVSERSADQSSTVLAVPIKIRNQTLGVLNLRVSAAAVSPELVDLVEGAVNRLSISLENARLLEDLQARANRERLVGEISSKVRSATDIESILRTTAGELGRSLGVAEVVIQLNQLK